MKKLDYLKYAILHKCAYKVKWVISAFAITKGDVVDTYLGALKVEPWGLSFFNDNGEYERIEDSVPNEPLFKFLDSVTIDNTWLPNVEGSIYTTIGNVIYNQLAIVYGFGNKYPFVTGKVNISDIEDNIAVKLQDTPVDETKRSNQFFYVDEYLKFVEGTKHLEHFAKLTSQAGTRNIIVPPPGLKEFKAKLVEKYGDKLTDPVELAKFKQELASFDAEFLKNDPAYKSFFASGGNLKNNGRMRMYLTMGMDEGFDESPTIVPLVNSLEDGWSTKPEEYVAMMNGIRSGSFSRGSETVKGGVAAKVLLRAANNFTIKDSDCGSKLGIKRTYTKDNSGTLVGRYVISNGKSILVEDKQQATSYIDKEVTTRSPAFCKEKGDTICKVCAGNNLASYPTGISIPLTEISAIILVASLKRMHSSELKLGKLDINAICN